jgi:hypothetical protein
VDTLAARSAHHKLLPVLFILLFVIPTGKAGAAAKPGTLEPNKGRDDVHVAVLPTQLENAEDISWAESLITGQINNILNSFSDVTILSRDRNILNQIQRELEFQLSY